jgi:hypothetical protein
VVFGSVVATEVLKYRVLGRPALINEPGHWVDNTFPSGHTAIAVSLGLALVMVTPQRRRTIAGAVGFLYASIIGSGVLAAGWHRPSDPMGSICLAFAIACVVCAGLVAWRGGVDLPDHTAPRIGWVRVLVWVGVVAFPIVVVTRTIVGHHPQLVWSSIGRHFVVASASIDGLCLVAFLGFVLLLRSVTLDAPRAPTGDQPVSELTTNVA